MFQKNKNNLMDYMKIAEDIKHTTNSLVRLQILFSLYESNKTMKEINESTKLSYSAISTNIRILELEDHVSREENRYFLSNVMKLYIMNLKNLDDTLELLDDFQNIFERHKIRNIPFNSIFDIHMIKDSHLIESSGQEIYKINEIIIDILKNSNEIKAVLPISFKGLRENIEDFIKKDKKIELKIANEIFHTLTRNIDCKKIKIEEFKRKFNFLLLVSSDTMILGFHKKEGSFDQNRIILSKSNESVKWANSLFESI